MGFMARIATSAWSRKPTGRFRMNGAKGCHSADDPSKTFTQSLCTPRSRHRRKAQPNGPKGIFLDLLAVGYETSSASLTSGNLCDPSARSVRAAKSTFLHVHCRVCDREGQLHVVADLPYRTTCGHFDADRQVRDPQASGHGRA